MKSIILAAGEGTRLRPYTLKRPKCMVEVNGRSLLDRQLDVLEAVGIKENIIIGGYLSEKLSDRGSKLYLNPKYDQTNMVWTLFCAEEELLDDVIVTYGDIVYSKDILEKLISSDADISVVVDMEWKSYWESRLENPLDDAETLKLSDDGQILELGQDPKSLDEIEGQYIGLMKFTEAGLKKLKSTFAKAKNSGRLGERPVENAYMTDMLQEIINDGYPVKAVPVRSPWVEVDTVEDLESEVTLKRLRLISLSQ
jgi:L-glutamine-phosphate cytidylyltransferase